MASRLFLIDGMALAYRSHFAFAARPIRTSKGFNTSALFGFLSTVLDILETESPTHLAVASDTPAPTPRHVLYPEYKAQREAMPEELASALPHLPRLIEALRLPFIRLDGFEADDLIGTLAKRAEKDGFETYMVTPDKDFGQLVSATTKLWKPGKQGSPPEVLGPAEVCARWSIQRVDQVIDMLGLMGDASDNIPGVPGVGEKTAAKLLAQYDTLEGVLAHGAEIKGKLGESVRAHAEIARLSRQLATIITDAPVQESFDRFAVGLRDHDQLQALCVEFEFNSLGRRLFGDAFKAGRGTPSSTPPPSPGSPLKPKPKARTPKTEQGQQDLFGDPAPSATATSSATPDSQTPDSEPTAPTEFNETTEPGAQPSSTSLPALATAADVPHHYRLVTTHEERLELIRALLQQPAVCFDTETTGLDPRSASLLGVSFSFEPGRAWYVSTRGSDAEPVEASQVKAVLEDLAPFFRQEHLEKVGHNLKFDLLILQSQGLSVVGPFFDTMIAHALAEPELRHGMDYLSEALLGYSPIPIERLIGPKGAGQKTMDQVPLADVAEYAAEDADVTWQLRQKLAPLLAERQLERVFREVEMPALPAIVAMEHHGIRLDTAALAQFSRELASDMARFESEVHRLAGREFNVNSPKQLGEVLFDELKLLEKPKRTPSGQYATDEQTLLGLAGLHPVVQSLLDYRSVAKLKSTYADALPGAVSPVTGRVHTTFHQAATATGRLSSVDPNLQNIPIRTERGQEIRRAFVAREGWQLLSADYSQIELRIIAALSREEAMIQAFRDGQDIHRATAARVFSVAPEDVTAEMRRRAKMVNFGIAYGISAFGLSQRLGIPRSESAKIIEHYFASYPGIRRYIDQTIEFARQHGYVETLTGRRRLLRDIQSANATTRGAAERNAINTPIQGTAADMIKVAMGRIQSAFVSRSLRSQLLLQVHDELVFDLHPEEDQVVREIVESGMRDALPLPGNVPIEVEIGVGRTWLEAH
ncbi:MAG: DNA polymerase I [Verrucomicrobiales bacterium]|nr:DNA polymerase I [Verrucomicrobiales bacterium]